ncbi:hypothetical protein [Formosa sp. PL04]|uniref:hypothetical protein n=1 Tax=Formosa sp. PL04 TaxID=3081755 RepID=UPI0029829727|nr:hypothetical protein [Formosa sp. PL04]MDW5290641.1 hypothetical protein [Formosa sp. PL04]
MKKHIIIFFLNISISSCGGAKYSYNFEKGKNINFESGKWILNEPFTNYKDNDAYKYAKVEFEEILGDSLVELIKLRQTKIIEKKLPLNPTTNELSQIKKFSGSNFLINIESKIEKNQMGSSSHHTPDFGTAIKYNEAWTKIRIYDLDKLELISESTAFGQVKVTKRSEDDESVLEGLLDYTTPGKKLALKTIEKLIRKYDKYRQE